MYVLRGRSGLLKGRVGIIELILQLMSVTRNQNLNLEIKNFIQLLQKSQKQSPKEHGLSVDSDKLSVIYSASEPESTIPDKESKHQSNNNYQTQQLFAEMEQLFRQMRQIRPTVDQARILAKIQTHIQEVKNILQIQQYKIAQIQSQLTQTTVNAEEVLATIIKMDQDHKKLWDSYQAIEGKYLQMEKQNNAIKWEASELRQKLIENDNDMQFMKTLVLVANENYEKMERECKHLSTQNKLLESFREQRNSPELTSRSTIYQKKSSFSPSISEKSNISSKKAESDENYRRLVLRTLKNKAIR